MIKNCIFDFGNVLAVFDPERLAAPYFDDEKLRLEMIEVIFDRFYWDRLDAGVITDDEVKEGIRSRVASEYAKKACDAYDGWIKNLEPFEGMAECVRAVKAKGIGIYLLSNISTGFANTYREVKWIRELFELFDGLVFSGEINLVKPDEEIFRYLLDKYGLSAEECVFVDDSAKNIAGAEKAGIKGVLFEGNPDVVLNLFE